MTEDEFDKLTEVRTRLTRARRLEGKWSKRLEQAQAMDAKVKGELAQLEAEAESLGAKAGLAKGKP